MNPLNRQASFGGIPRVIKPTDYDLGSLTPPTYPQTYLPNVTITIEDQLQEPDCGANAGVAMKEILDSTQLRLSVQYLWDKIKLIDGIPPADGTSMDFIFEVLNKTGVCTYSLLPTNSNLSVADFTNPANITPIMDSDALQRRIGAYAFTNNPTIDQLKSTIATHGHALMLLRVGAEFWTAPDGTITWNASQILPLNPNDYPITSGHFMLAYGYDEQYIYFINSWGTGWANNGLGYFGANYLPRCIEIGASVNLVNAPYTFVPTIKFGDVGLPVKMLQIKLGVVPVDGIFGSITSNAVKAFQTANGLVPDGIVGILTCEKLNQ